MDDLTPAVSRWAVFLDRDGTLNHHVLRDGRRSTPRSVDELVLVDGAVAALSRLRAAGACVVVVTNQPDLDRGFLHPDQAEEFDRQLRHRLGVSDVYTCPHTSARACGCRKPASGLFHRAAADHGLRLADSYMIGDRAVDAQAAVNAGVTAVILGAQTWVGAGPHVCYATGLDVAASLVLRHRVRSARAESAVHD